MKPNTKTQNRSANSGFTLVEIMIVVAIIGLLAAIAIPNFVRARTKSQTTACVEQISKMNGAADQWALENGKGTGAQIDSDNIRLYMSGNNAPECPAKGSYTFGKVGDAQQITCSISSHTDAAYPTSN